MPNRPQRLHVINELGQRQTLSGEENQFQFLVARSDAPLLLLGLGPEPEQLARRLGTHGAVFYLEAPAFVEQAPPAWKRDIPKDWRRLGPEDLELSTVIEAASDRGAVLLYRPAPRLFPSFWGPILAQAVWRPLAHQAPEAVTRSVLLAIQSGGLLGQELRQGFAAHGLEVHSLELPPNEDPHLPRLLAQLRPALFCSVNFHGLDPHGERFHLLQAAGATVAVWCVDNPWHLLSGCKSGFWREVELFVTDASFIPALHAAGARRVHHLPLGASPALFASGAAASPPVEALDQALVFVGRSNFPDKDSFFAGCSLPSDIWETALELLDSGRRPDFAWWHERLGAPALWPGRQARQVGFCAEQSARHLRLHSLRQAAGVLPLHVFGDGQWPHLLPELGNSGATGGTHFHPPVDYYGSLAAVYGHSRYTLNVTSLLLPAGLTQRHFDVFCAGGFLLSDATPGLDIFPRELTEPCTVGAVCSRQALGRRIDALERSPGLRQALVSQWRDLLAQEHDYVRRTRTILEASGLG